MKIKNVIMLITIIVVIISIFYAFQGSTDDPAYLKEIASERTEKDNFMRTGDESPFAKSKADFTGLKYFPVDLKYRIVANLNPIKEKKALILATSDGKEEHYLEYAFAEFDLNDAHNKLLILEVMDMGPMRNKLFLAFGDATSGLETYGAGRYLDISKVPGSSTIMLDFNKAYNPYCAYNDTYSCPFPPKENLLNIPIKAGEKNYH
jgi:uncharacterized protein (DUF1684 family)